MFLAAAAAAYVCLCRGLDIMDESKRVERRTFGGSLAAYLLQDLLGRGTFGHVYKECRADGEIIAVKRIDKVQHEDWRRRHDSRMCVSDEFTLLSDLKHGNVVKMYGSFESVRFFFIEMECVDGESLLDRLMTRGPLAEAEARTTFRQILAGIQCLHTTSIAHRDLKPDHFILQVQAASITVKVIDFGLARASAELHGCKTVCGTPATMAPEIFDEAADEYGRRADMWSLGVVLYNMLLAEEPFDSGDSLEDLVDNIVHEQWAFDEVAKQQLSSSAQGLLAGLLQASPCARLPVEAAMESTWLQTGSNDDAVQTAGEREEHGAAAPQASTCRNAGEERNRRRGSHQISSNDSSCASSEPVRVRPRLVRHASEARRPNP